MTIQIDNKDHQKGIASNLMDNCKDQMETGWMPGAKGSYRYAARLHPPAPKTPIGSPWSKDYMLIQADPRNAKGGFVRMEWNPSKFDAEQQEWLFTMLDQQLDLIWFHIRNGIVTRADIAVDLPGVYVDHYIFDRPKSPIRWPYFKNGAMQTTYMGKSSQGPVPDLRQARRTGRRGSISGPRRNGQPAQTSRPENSLVSRTRSPS
jgi:hypothetical protein